MELIMKNNYYKICIILLGILLIIRIIDIIMTIYGLKIEGIIEGNILGFNLFSLILYSILFPITLFGIYLSKEIKTGLILFIIIISFSCIIGFFVITNNINIIRIMK